MIFVEKPRNRIPKIQTFLRNSPMTVTHILIQPKKQGDRLGLFDPDFSRSYSFIFRFLSLDK